LRPLRSAHLVALVQSSLQRRQIVSFDGDIHWLNFFAKLAIIENRIGFAGTIHRR
jgi:hypothetical protein